MGHRKGIASDGRRRGAWLRRFLRARDGYSAVEFAFIVPIFIAMVAGAAELGNYGVEYIRLTNAAKAGTHYGLQDQSTAADKVNIEAAVRNDAGDVNGTLDVFSDRYCQCPESDTPDDCTGECDDTNYVPMYLVVTVTNEHNALFPFLELPLLSEVTASTVVRVR